MYRLLGPHVNAVMGGLPEFVGSWKPPVLVTVAREQAWNWVKEVSPKTLVVLRPFEDDSLNPDFNQPFDILTRVRFLLLEAERRVRGIAFDFLQMDNECVMGSEGAVARKSEFDAEMCRQANAKGWKVTVGNFSTGVPEVEWWDSYHEALQAAKEHGCVLLLHEYNWPDMLTPDADWYSLRHRRVYERLPRELRIQLIIGETSLDEGVRIPGSRRGWNGFISPQKLLEMLFLYDQELQKDKYVLGAAIFCCGNLSGFWVSYDTWTVPIDELARHADPLYRTLKPPEGWAWGPDVSDHKGVIKWVQVRDAGASFALPRSSVRMSRDAYYWRNQDKIHRRKLPQGPWHFPYASHTPGDQAALMARTMTHDQMGGWLDVEQVKNEAQIDRHFVKAFLDEYERLTGEVCGVYTSWYQWRQLVGDVPWAGRHPLWVADWRDVDEPKLPVGWDDWVIWQYTSKGSVRGIAGRVDLNRLKGDLPDW